LASTKLGWPKSRPSLRSNATALPVLKRCGRPRTPRSWPAALIFSDGRRPPARSRGITRVTMDSLMCNCASKLAPLSRAGMRGERNCFARRWFPKRLRDFHNAIDPKADIRRDFTAIIPAIEPKPNPATPKPGRANAMTAQPCRLMGNTAWSWISDLMNGCSHGVFLL
jgi:hypothetical protein